MIGEVLRHRTALSRTRLSRPMEQALRDAVISQERTVFDYGCGRGDDLRNLAAVGITAQGWDPTHRPSTRLSPADVVNLGYVVNVIEGREERAETLVRAWGLARRVLVVAARLTWDQRELAGRPMGDGVVTRSGTFQKFYEQTELASWIEQTLDVHPVAASPGIFYVFRDAADAQQFLATRVSTYQPRVRIDPHAMYQAHRDVLAPLVDFLTDHARTPRADELPPEAAAPLLEAFRTVARAHSVIREVTDGAVWDEAAAVRQSDLLVYIGLSRFGRRPRIGELPSVLARDIKAHFGSYQNACVRADRMLAAAGQSDLLVAMSRRSRVGKLTPSALYVHRSALGQLPPLLRLYEGCAQVLAGTVEVANVIKLSVTQPQVSYLIYPRFDRDAHPALAAAITVNLRRLTVDLRDFSSSDNPPILHRKEEFVAPGYPHRELWARLTSSEVRKGLFTHTERIGTVRAWQAALAEAGVSIRGHRLVNSG